MMTRRLTALAMVAAFCLPAVNADATVMSFTDETAYLNALAATSYATFAEGFEDDGAWGGVRSVFPASNTAASVLSQGITWSSSATGSQITTGSGAARTGNWGLYAIPHGNQVAGPDFQTDRLGGSSATTLYAVGGYVRTNTPFANANLLIDGASVDFIGDTTFGTAGAFFGVIDDTGFSTFEIVETEGAIDDLKYIFADDFTFAAAASAAAIPEPGALSLLGLGLGGLGLARRRKAG